MRLVLSKRQVTQFVISHEYPQNLFMNKKKL